MIGLRILLPFGNYVNVVLNRKDALDIIASFQSGIHPNTIIGQEEWAVKASEIQAMHVFPLETQQAANAFNIPKNVRLSGI
jgi:hypothetical protein